MLLDTPRAQLTLADDEVARLRDACDSRLEVTAGFVWLTVEGERADVVLAAGECYRVVSAGAVTLSAIRGPAVLRLRAEPGGAGSRPAARGALAGRLRRMMVGVTLSADAVA